MRARAHGTQRAAAARPIQLLAGLSLWAGAGVTLAATAGLASLSAGLRLAWGAAHPPLLALAVVASAIALRAALLVVPPERGAARRLYAMHARALLVTAVLAALVNLVWLQPFRLELGLLTMALAGGLYGGLALILARREGRLGRLGRGADMLLFSVAIALLGLELGLRQAAARGSHSMLADPSGGDARAVLEAYRMQPGEVRFRFPINSRGDYDREWTGREPGQRLVVCIGDSFSIGVVPHPLHFTSVAERLLEDTRVYNMGAPAVGPAEYLLMLEEEALPMRPDLVVINLFVGNDLYVPPPCPKDVPWLRSWFDQNGVVLTRLLKRLQALSAERARRGGEPVGVSEALAGSGWLATTPAAAEEAFPFTVDPLLERPSFSTEAFMAMQKGRVEVCEVDGPPFEQLEELLARMKKLCGRVPMAIFLIPDELQISDAQWEEVTAAHPGVQFERFRPQRLVRAWCEANGVDLIDTTPAILGAPPLADGRSSAYHLRDTHWNALGNRLAGEVLAGYLRERFAP